MKALTQFILLTILMTTANANLGNKDARKIKRIKAKTYKCVSDVMLSRKGAENTIKTSASILDDLQHAVASRSNNYRNYRSLYKKCEKLQVEVESEKQAGLHEFLDKVRAYTHISDNQGNEEKIEKFLRYATSGNNTVCTVLGVNASASVIVGLEAGFYVSSCENRINGHRFYMVIPEAGVNLGVGVSFSFVHTVQSMRDNVDSSFFDHGESGTLALFIVGANEFNADDFDYGTYWGGCEGCKDKGHTIGLALSRGHRVAAGIKVYTRSTNVKLADENLL